ncbi:MAG: energy-coupling factor transporter transmembrane protein EcfT [Spirochaetales bacterium]|nr:energy-coupling factor transporter transmembrane protein EcfT [Spirochaetales bacterium]
MLRNVTLGRYYPAKSVLHSLDPRTKLCALIIYIVTVFMAGTPVSLACTFLVLCILVALSRVPVRYMVKGLLPVAVILAITATLNIIFAADGVWKAVLITARTLEVVFGSNILTLTTKPRALADGVEKGLSWMRVLKVPVHDIAMTVSIAFRFIPILASEAGTVMDAQKSRGASFNGGLIKRSRALIPVAVPLFASAFRHADELSDAMDSRLYGYSRTGGSLHPLRYRGCDMAAYVMMLCYMVAMIIMKVVGA